MIAFIGNVIAVETLISLEPKSRPNSGGVKNPHFSARGEKLEPFNPHREKRRKNTINQAEKKKNNPKVFVESILFLLNIIPFIQITKNGDLKI